MSTRPKLFLRVAFAVCVQPGPSRTVPPPLRQRHYDHGMCADFGADPRQGGKQHGRRLRSCYGFYPKLSLVESPHIRPGTVEVVPGFVSFGAMTFLIPCINVMPIRRSPCPPPGDEPKTALRL